MHRPGGRRREGASRRILATLLAGGLVLAACGDDSGTQPTNPATNAPTSPTPPEATTTSVPGTTVARGGARWETVVTLTGTGPSEPPAFPIIGDAIQWRTRWRCDAGRMRITAEPAPRRGGPMVDENCPGRGDGFAIATGDIRLKIEASGPWEVIVDQQVDAPLLEPPFEGMATAPLLRQGNFYPVEKEAKGTGRIFKRADGANVLRLEDFEVSTNTDLFVWLSETPEPKTTAEALASPYVVLGNLKSTLGNQNYVLPADLPLERVRSLVIWCEPVRIVYGAAALTP